MVRKNNHPKVAVTRANQAAANELRDQQRRLPPEPVTPPASGAYSPVFLSPPPQLSFNEYRRVYLENMRTTVEASLMPLPDDGDDDLFPSYEDDVKSEEDDWNEKMEHLRVVWRSIGYHTNHPNHNAANASEAQVEEMFKNHHRLGPVIQQYKLLINPSKMHSLLLQFPNRENDQEYRAATGQKPLELRWKPKCGLVELDIPLNIHHNYDKEKGIQYGEALRNSRVLQQRGSYGLAGGMGVGSKPSKDDKRAPPPEGPTTEKLLANFDDSNNKGHVMNKITLGGQIVPFKDGDPIYMTATFRGDTCTWTKLDAMVQLRPQFSHIDALHEQDKPASRKELAAEEKAAENPEANEPKAVNMAVKSAEKDDDQNMYGGMAETARLLSAMRDEPWQRLTWVDQDEDESYDIYDENLVYQDPENAPMLVSELTEEQYLDAISCPRIDPNKEAREVMLGGENAAISVDNDSNEESEVDLEDTEEEDEEETESLPPGVVRPDDLGQQRTIEVVCRIICSRYEAKDDGAAETHLRKKFRGNPDRRFLEPHNRHYRYFKWRLAENRAGRGHDPEDYLPALQ